MRWELSLAYKLLSKDPTMRDLVYKTHNFKNPCVVGGETDWSQATKGALCKAGLVTEKQRVDPKYTKWVHAGETDWSQETKDTLCKAGLITEKQRVDPKYTKWVYAGERGGKTDWSQEAKDALYEAGLITEKQRVDPKYTKWVYAGEIGGGEEGAGSMLATANSRVKAGTAVSADHTRVNNNAVLSGVACGQPIALGKSSVKHAQLVKARVMIAKQCETPDYESNRVKGQTPYGQSSEEFKDLVKSCFTRFQTRELKILYPAYIMLFRQPSMDINKVGCITAQRNRAKAVRLSADQC